MTRNFTTLLMALFSFLAVLFILNLLSLPGNTASAHPVVNTPAPSAPSLPVVTNSSPDNSGRGILFQNSAFQETENYDPLILSVSGQSLLPYLESFVVDPVEDERGLFHLRRAIALGSTDSLAAARVHFDSARALVPLLEDWINLRHASAEARRGNTREVSDLLSLLPQSFQDEFGWEVRLQTFKTNGEQSRALEFLMNRVSELPGEHDKSHAYFDLAKLQEETGREGEARASYIRAMTTLRRGAHARNAAYALSQNSELSPEELRQIGLTYFVHGNSSRASSYLKRYLSRVNAASPQALEARLRLGQALYRASEFSSARSEFLKIARASTAEDQLVAEALYEAGRSSNRLGESDTGRSLWLELHRKFPSHPLSAKAQFLVADLAHDDRNWNEAVAFYTRSIEGSGTEAELSFMRLGGLAYAQNRYEEAAEWFSRYREKFPAGDRRQQSMYWEAQSLTQAGESASAETLLRELANLGELSYYVILASDHTGIDKWQAPLRESVSELHPSAPAERLLHKLELLEALDWGTEVDFEVAQLDVSNVALSTLYSYAEKLGRTGRTIKSVNLGWDIYRRLGEEYTPRVLRIIYPLPYRDIIIREAEEKGLSPSLVSGLIRQESLFVPDIKSHAGAVGLMQIMPPTGRGLAARAGINDFSVKMLEDPEINIELGTLYLQELLDRFGGSHVAILGSYNAGPHRVRRWLEFPEARDERLLAERIPYSETRHYTKVVQKNARIYKELYNLP